MAITVVKRNGEREPYDANKINLAIEHASAGLDENITWVTQIASELELTLFDGITTQQLDEAVIQVALQNVKDDPAFDTVAARLLLKTIYKAVLGDYETDAELKGSSDPVRARRPAVETWSAPRRYRCRAGPSHCGPSSEHRGSPASRRRCERHPR